MKAPATPEVRGFATNVTALSIIVLGVAFLAATIYLISQGSTGAVLLGILVGILALATLTGGFLFLLVPSKVDEIQDEAEAQGAPSKLE